MNYEELRRKFERHIGMARRRRRLMKQTESGELSPGEIAACDQEIAELGRKGSQFAAEFDKLQNAGDFAALKLQRELEADPSISKQIELWVRDEIDAEEKPISLLQKARSFVGTISLLILGTQMIDHWRYGPSRK